MAAQGARLMLADIDAAGLESLGATLRLQGCDCHTCVTDTGSGIPEAFRQRIFGRFTQADSTATRQKGGTGLGLAICRRLLELMHGRIMRGIEKQRGLKAKLFLKAVALGQQGGVFRP